MCAGNDITSVGVQAFLDMMFENFVITTLDFDGKATMSQVSVLIQDYQRFLRYLHKFLNPSHCVVCRQPMLRHIC